LLALLLAHAGEIVTKDEIMEALWPSREVSETSLTVCMARLRQALGEAGHGAIRTVHGYGYRFTAAVAMELTAPVAAVLPAGVAFAPGDPVPHRPNWRLVQRLGTGGYGDAWLAEQAKSQERRVIKFARDANGLAALRREVALARLLREGLGPRPDLIRILDWSFAAPPEFIETPWAEAGNLADWAAAQGGAAALPLDLRLDLAAQIAEALAAIHTMAVLHKDLKPANVLMRLDAAGRPAIILTDFGSGRALDPARLDAFGITRPDPETTGPDSSGGTQIYRAPELAAGGAPTVQADIFALGVVLFQLAAGDLQQPLAPGWEELIPDPLLREDIAAAAAGDPARRLADAAALAHRLRALPERRAARARAAEAAAEAVRIRRALDLARARRAPLLALIGALLIGFATSTLLYVRAQRAQARAEQAQQAAEAHAARARSVVAFLTDDLFSAANPLLGADPNVPIRRVLGVAAADLDRRFPHGNPDRAAIEAAIGSAYGGLADPDHALPLLRAALADLRLQLGENDPQTQAVRLAMGTLAEHKHDYPAMREAGRAMLAAGPRDAQTELSARTFLAMADCGEHTNPDACVAHFRPLFADAVHRLGPKHPVTLNLESALAVHLGWAQHVDQSIPLARETAALTQAVYGADHLLTQQRRFDLADVLVEAGKRDEAIPMLIDIRRRMLAITGAETDITADVANTLGTAYIFGSRHAESLPVLQIVLDYATKTRGPSSVMAMQALSNIACALRYIGRTRDSIAKATKVRDLLVLTHGPDDPDTLYAGHNLGIDYRFDGNLPAAEAVLRDVVARARRVFTHGEFFPGLYECDLAEVLIAEHRNDEARALLNQSIATLRQSLGPAHRHTVYAQTVLASLTAPN
jgi:non-specific serine/threonine protein kinase